MKPIPKTGYNHGYKQAVIDLLVLLDTVPKIGPGVIQVISFKEYLKDTFINQKGLSLGDIN